MDARPAPAAGPAVPLPPAGGQPLEVLLGTIRRRAATPDGAACLVAVVELLLPAGHLAAPAGG
eukprot:12910776-Alexandrium_andersonii.AAC.1